MSDKVGSIVFGPAPEHPEIAAWWREQCADLAHTMARYQAALRERDSAREDRSILLAANLVAQAERDALASVVTRQRSEIDTLRAENELLRSHASQRLLDALDGPKICPVCHNQGGDLEDSSKPCYECGR